MKYKDLKIVLWNGMELDLREMAKITGIIQKANKKIKFEIDLNNKNDVYKLYKNFRKEVEELKKKV